LVGDGDKMRTPCLLSTFEEQMSLQSPFKGLKFLQAGIGGEYKCKETAG
jgi:hypothetical protein